MRIDCFPCVRLRPPVGLYERSAAPSESFVAKFMRRVYAPLLLHHEVKRLVLAIFGGIFMVAIIGIQHINLGLGELTCVIKSITWTVLIRQTNASLCQPNLTSSPTSTISIHISTWDHLSTLS